MKEKLVYPIAAAIASMCILYADIFTISIKNSLFSEFPDYLKPICSLSFTIFLWGTAIAFLLCILKSKTYLNLFSKAGGGLSQSNTVLCVVIVLCMTAVMWIINGSFKPLKELHWFLGFGNMAGWTGFVLQNTYYVLEMLLALMIVHYGQIAGELLTLKRNIPWGSVLLSLAWGLPHIFTKNLSVGLFSLVFGLALGALYMLTGRNGRKALLYMSLAFIL